MSNQISGSRPRPPQGAERLEYIVPGEYRVKSGDTLSEIAERFHTPMAAIYREEGDTWAPVSNPNKIRAGEPLIVGEWSAAYVVQPGDTLSKIGQDFGIDYRELAQANEIADPNKIKAGDAILIPADNVMALVGPGMD